MSYRFNLGSAYRAHCERCGHESLHVRGACCHHETKQPQPSYVNTPIGSDWTFNNKTIERAALKNRRRALAGMRAAK